MAKCVEGAFSPMFVEISAHRKFVNFEVFCLFDSNLVVTLVSF